MRLHYTLEFSNYKNLILRINLLQFLIYTIRQRYKLLNG